MNFLYIAAVVCLVLMFVGWFLMVVGHAASVRECEERGHIWERVEWVRSSFLMCMRCGRRAN